MVSYYSPLYWFVAEKKFNWREFLVDESRAPVNHKQASDPDWKNYKWNTSDILAEMLKARAVTENKAKLGIFAAVAATADPVPPWMTRKGLTWRDSSRRVRVRFDLEDGWRYTADFLVALVRRYGETPRISNLGIGEYYPGSDAESRPANFDFDAFRAKAKKIWADVTSNAPKDANGNRLNILQSNPIMTGGITQTADIAELKLGVTGSGDPYLFVKRCGEPDDVLCDPGTLDRARQDLYGVVPLQHQANANVFDNGVAPVTWTEIESLSGFTADETVPIKLEHVTWYFGSKGVIPLNSMLIKSSSVVTDQ